MMHEAKANGQIALGDAGVGESAIRGGVPKGAEACPVIEKAPENIHLVKVCAGDLGGVFCEVGAGVDRVESEVDAGKGVEEEPLEA